MYYITLIQNQRFWVIPFLATSELSSLLRASSSHYSLSMMIFFLKEQQGACWKWWLNHDKCY